MSHAPELFRATFHIPRREKKILRAYALFTISLRSVKGLTDKEEMPAYLLGGRSAGNTARSCRAAFRETTSAATGENTVEQSTLGRSWRIVGGLFMNLALGSLYAWSVFVAPLEKEFGWKRADTSLVFTWAIVVFALSFIIAGRLQDKLGPFKISLAGCILLTAGLSALRQDRQPDVPDRLLRRPRRHRQRLRLRDSDPGHGQVVPGQARPGRRPGRGRLRRRFGHLRAAGEPLAHPDVRLARHVRRARRRLLRHDRSSVRSC